MDKKNGIFIYDWMVKNKGLSGNELVCYALLYRETKNGTESFCGGYEVIATAMGVTFPTAYNVLRKLESKGLVKYFDYSEINVVV